MMGKKAPRKTLLTIRIPGWEYKKFRAFARANNTTVKPMIAEAIREIAKLSELEKRAEA